MNSHEESKRPFHVVTVSPSKTCGGRFFSVPRFVDDDRTSGSLPTPSPKPGKKWTSPTVKTSKDKSG